jgi:predicted Zn-ribbon and HTH transcriptional regulator
MLTETLHLLKNYRKIQEHFRERRRRIRTMSATTKVNRQDIRRIISNNFNDTDYRFSNDEILGYLNELDKYKQMNLDVLDFEDVLLEMEESGFLRPIAQNFNTRYYKIMTELESKTCKDCNVVSWFAEAEDPKQCPQCRSKNLS